MQSPLNDSHGISDGAPRRLQKRRTLRVALIAGLLSLAGIAGAAAVNSMIVTDLTLIATLHEPAGFHVDQAHLLSLIVNGQGDLARDEAFEEGDELFETPFNALDGGGANVGEGQRFTRVPRADLDGPGEWANHFPARETGPNAAACNECHNNPPTGAGPASSNVHRDPTHSGDLGLMIRRDTPHMMGSGALQLLAEEMTEEMHAMRDALAADALAEPGWKEVALVTKGVSFGSLRVRRNGASGTLTWDHDAVEGVDQDLVVKPYQWKGTEATMRSFVRGAMHNEVGMQPVELVGDGVDGDFDGVANETTIGDITAITIYCIGQPRPVTRVELGVYGEGPVVPAAEIADINAGEVLFDQIGCTECHVPTMLLDDATFREPSQNLNYRDAVLPAGQDPVAVGLDPANPIEFDLTEDQPDNVLTVNGQEVRLGSFPKAGPNNEGALITLYGDLKRHDLGPGLAESIDEAGTGASVFMTENLWGVGTTAPYMHDGRATTLTEAILEHGGEGAASRAGFRALTPVQQAQVIAFLNNLVLHKPEE